MVRVIGALGVLSVLLLASCGSSDSSSDGEKKSSGDETTTTEGAASGDLELDGKSFVGSGIEGYEPVAGSDLSVSFEDGSMSVNAGCNTMSGAYEVADGTLKWSDSPAATMMGCPDDLMNQDTWLIDLLTKGVDVAADGDDITFTSGDVVITLSPVADAELEGTTWTLESLVSKDAVSSVATPQGAPTLTIDADGKTQVFTGCNTGNTTTEVGDGTLTFAPMAMTRMMCEDAAEVEAAVTTVLDGETTYTIEGSTLTIMKGDDGLVYRSGA